MNKYKNFLVEDFLHDRFFCDWAANKCAKEDSLLWERWMSDNQQMIEIVEESKSIFLSFNDQPASVNDNFYLSLKNRIDNTINTKRKKKPFFAMGRWQIAAVFIGLMVVAGILFYSSSVKNEFISYSSNYAETKKIILADGSVVILNAKSSLKYKNTPGEKREVWVDGEAFFSVKHVEDADKKPLKFIVHTNNLDVEVLGTQFNVNTIKKNETEVLLTRGKVRLTSSKTNLESVTMSPGEFVSFANRNKLFSKQKVKTENYIAWLSHKYIFEKTTLDELSKQLFHYYGKQFIIQDSKMRAQQLSGTLELQDQETLIKTLSVLLKAPVKEVNNQIVIGA